VGDANTARDKELPSLRVVDGVQELPVVAWEDNTRGVDDEGDDKADDGTPPTLLVLVGVVRIQPGSRVGVENFLPAAVSSAPVMSLLVYEKQQPQHFVPKQLRSHNNP